MSEIRCSLCLEFGGKSFDFSSQPSQIWKTHFETHRLQVGDSGRSSLRYYSLCFPNDKRISRSPKVGRRARRAESQSKVDENAHLELRAHCYALAKKCTTKKIKCSECGTQVVFRKTNGNYRLDGIYEHAIRHLHKKIFDCSYCDFQTATKGLVKNHIISKHTKPPLYVDRTAELKDEIKTVIGRCFGGQSLFGASKPKSKSIFQSPSKFLVTNTIGARPKCRNNNPPAIYWCCVKLAKNFSKDGFISCRRCAKRITVDPFIGGTQMVYHVTGVHLKRPLFLCGHCKKSFCAYQNVVDHLRHVHSCGATGNYVDQRKKYESDIIDMLSKCFALESTSKDEEKNQDDEIVQLKDFVFGDTTSMKAVEAKGTTPLGPSNKVEGRRFRFSCDRCDYATNYRKLIESHEKLRHA